MSPKRIHFVVAALAALLTGLRLLLWLFPTTVTPLPVAHHVVLLLVPGLSTDNADYSHDMPTLTALMRRFPVALLKVTPDENFSHACSRIGGADKSIRPTNLLRVLAGSDEAFPIAGEGCRVLFSEEWRKPDPDAADGYSIHLNEFRKAILDSVPTDSSNSKQTMVVAVYDDLDNAEEYAPLALPNVAREQKRNAIHQFDNLLKMLTDKNETGMPDNTILLVAAPTGATGERFTPLLLWKRDGASSGLLTIPGKGAIPGILPGEVLLPTVHALLGTPSSVKRAPVLVPGNIASLLYRADALSVRERSRAYLIFVLALPTGAALLALTLFFFQQKRLASTIAVTVVATPLLLYIAGSIANWTTNDLSVIAIAMGLALFVSGLLVPEPFRKNAIPALCLLSLGTLTGDALMGGWLALATPLALRPEAVWGIVSGSLLLALFPLLPRTNFVIPILWGVIAALLLPLCGPIASLLCLLYATGIIVIAPDITPRRKQH